MEALNLFLGHGPFCESSKSSESSAQKIVSAHTYLTHLFLALALASDMWLPYASGIARSFDFSRQVKNTDIYVNFSIKKQQ